MARAGGSAGKDREAPDESDPNLVPGSEAHDMLDLLRQHRELVRDHLGATGSPPLPPGFRLVRVLRWGGQAFVCEAEEQATGKPVAIKVFLPTAGGVEDLRSQRELEFIRRLHHPHLVRLYDSGVADGRVYLVMELVRGQHLDVWVTKEHPSARDLAQLMVIIARAIHFAHQRGVIHRDLKPSNILVDGSGRPVVLDFGIAKPVHPSLGEAAVTLTGEFAGTLPYAAPEQLSGKPGDVDIRVDVHALGLLLYESLRGRHPWEDRTSLQDLIKAITSEPVPRFADAGLRVDPDLEAVVRHAIEKDPADRYASAEGFARDLERWLVGDPVEARGRSNAYLLRKALLRHRWLAAGIGLAFVALAAVTWFVVGLWGEAKEAAQRAQRAEASAATDRDLAQSALAERLQLSDMIRIRGLLAEEEELWPVGESLVAACRDWLSRAQQMLAQQPSHGDALRKLRQRARPYADEEKRQGHPLAMMRLDELADLLTQETSSPEDVAAWNAEREELRRVVDSVRLYWTYDDPDDALFEEQLGQLMDLMVELDGAKRSVESRQARSESLVARTLEGEAREAWTHCLRDLGQDPRFQSLELAPIPGLVPIGKHGAAQLWAFWHVESGERPVRSEHDGCFRLRAETGILLVLCPPGSYTLGADEDGDTVSPYSDPAAGRDAAPVHQVNLDAYFLSPFEMTLGQWKRFVARADGRADDGIAPEDVLPVEGVPFVHAQWVARSLDLSLPTEAQWEAACRAGSTTVYPWGDRISELQGRANVFDAGSFDGWDMDLQSVPTPGLSDGHSFAAPVGSYDPNPLGFFDMIGNVAEWCRDGYGLYDAEAPAPVDGLRRGAGEVLRRVNRGGSYLLAARFCTTARRHHASPDDRLKTVGLRLARGVAPR